MSPYIPEYEEDEALEEFITRVIEPSSANYERESKFVVHELVKHIQKLPVYSIHQVVKGGSFGKETFIEKTADIDLIIFFNGYNTVKELMHDKLKILKAIKRYLLSKRKPSWIQYIKYISSNEYLITFKIKLRDVENAFEVDMLPAIDIVKKYDGDMMLIYRVMKAEKKPVREHYSVCFAKVQKVLLKDQTKEVIHLIQLLKYCKKKFDLSITSYCCEVLTLFVISKYYRSRKLNMNNAFRRVLNLLTRYEKLHIVVSYHYREDYWHIHKEPYILDPVNPYSNTLYLLSKEKIDHLKTWAENTLQNYHKTIFSDTVYVPLIPHNNNEVAITIDPCTPPTRYNTHIKSTGTSKWRVFIIIGIVVMLISLLLYLFFKLRKDN